MMRRTTFAMSVLLLLSCQGSSPSPWLDTALQQTADSIGFNVVDINGFASYLHIVVVDSAGHRLAESTTISGENGQTGDFQNPRPGVLLFPLLLATVDSLDTTTLLPVGYRVYNGIPVVDDHAMDHDSLPLPQALLAEGSKVAAVGFCDRHYGHCREELRQRLLQWLPEQLPMDNLEDDQNFVRLCTGDFPVPPEALLEAYRKLVVLRPYIVDNSSGISTISTEGGAVTSLFIGHDHVNGHTCLIVVRNCSTHPGSLMANIATHILNNH